MLQTVTKRVEQPEPNAGDNRQAVSKAKLFIEKSILKLSRDKRPDRELFGGGKPKEQSRADEADAGQA